MEGQNTTPQCVLLCDDNDLPTAPLCHALTKDSEPVVLEAVVHNLNCPNCRYQWFRELVYSVWPPNDGPTVSMWN